jgi:hypothetical protein
MFHTIQDTGHAISTYPALLANAFPIVLVGAVEISGVYASYSQGFAADLTVSAPGEVYCAGRERYTVMGTSYGEAFNANTITF